MRIFISIFFYVSYSSMYVSAIMLLIMKGKEREKQTFGFLLVFFFIRDVDAVL